MHYTSTIALIISSVKIILRSSYSCSVLEHLFCAEFASSDVEIAVAHCCDPI